MAQSGDSYFSNAIVGVPQVAGDVDIYAQHDKPRFAIGTKFERQDGAVFRYSHFGAAINSAGLVLATDASESGMALTSAALVTSSSTYQMADEQSGTYPNCKGSKYMHITKGSISADDFAGAYVAITSANSQKTVGQVYRIKGNTATGTPASGTFRAELYNKLQVTFGSDSSCVIVGSKYSNLEAASLATTDGILAGVSILSSGTTYPYGWVLTKGITAILNEAAPAPLGSRAATLSSDTALAGCVGMCGANTAAVAQSMPAVGIYCADGSGGTFNFVDVRLE